MHSFFSKTTVTFSIVLLLLQPQILLRPGSHIARCFSFQPPATQIHAQEVSEPERYYFELEINQLMRQGEFTEALAVVKKSLAKCKDLENSHHRVISVRVTKEQLELLVKLEPIKQSEIQHSIQSLEKLEDNSKQGDEFLAEAKLLYEQTVDAIGATTPLATRIKFNIANQLGQQRRYRQQIDVLLECVPEYETLWTALHPNTIELKRSLAKSYYWLRESKKSAELLESCLQDSKQIVDFPQSETTGMLMGAGKAYVAMGNFDAAEERYERVKGILKDSDAEDTFEYANCLLLIGAMHLTNSDPIEAEPYLSKATIYFDATQPLGNPFRTTTRNYLASCQYKLGNLKLAKKLYEQTLREHEEHLPQNHPSKSACYLWLGRIAAEQGDAVSQQHYWELSYQMAVAIWGPKHPNCQASLASLASLYQQEEHYRKAEKLFRQALKNQEKGQPVNRMTTAFSLLSCLIDAAKYEEARETIVKCKALNEQHKFPETIIAKLYILECELAIELDQNELASEKLKLAESLLPTSSLRLAQKLGLLKALIARKNKNPRNAIEHLEAVMNLQNAFDHKYGISVSAATLENRKQRREAFHQYCRAIGDLIDHQTAVETDFESFCDHVIRFKGWVTESQRLISAGKREPQLRADLLKLRQLNSKLSHRLVSNSQQSSQRTRAIIKQKNELEQSLNNRLKEREFLQEINSRQLSSTLRPTEVFLDFLTYKDDDDNKLIAFLSRNGQPPELFKLGSISPIATELKTWSGGQGESVAAQKAGIKLRDLLWTPISKSIFEGDEVIVSADGIIGLIPLAALPSKTAGRFLVEDHLISYQISAQSLIRSRAIPQKPAAQPKLLLVGDPVFDSSNSLELKTTYTKLPKAANELQQVSAVFKNSQQGATAKSLVREYATAENFVEHVAGSSHIHIVTHGFWHGPEIEATLEKLDFEASRNVISGCMAGIVLTPPKDNRSASASLLSADDVTYLDLNEVSQVVLSGCNTGIGICQPGEGTASLQRAFYIAGADTVISSLWPVQDSATENLMTMYYENLYKKKMSNAESLRQAQISILKNGTKPESTTEENRLHNNRTSSPAKLNSAYRWGGFVLSGKK